MAEDDPLHSQHTSRTGGRTLLDHPYAQTLSIGSNGSRFSWAESSSPSQINWFKPTKFSRDMAELLAKDHDLEQGFALNRVDPRPSGRDFNILRPPVFRNSVIPGLLYPPLRTKEDFRLLEILPGTEEAIIRCSLHVCSMAENVGAYEALSYTWELGYEYSAGLSKMKAPGHIECNGITVEVGANLYHALRRLRLERTSRLLWIDAICINQDDIQERSQQVAIMGDIFRNAYGVLVWLGLGLPPIKPNASYEITPPPEEAFASVCAVVSTWAAAKGHTNLVGQAQYGGQRSDRHISDTPSVLEDTIIWPEILKLYSTRWFSRLWVIQEVALARHATVIWGNFEISWHWVGLAAAIIRTNWDRIAPFISQCGSGKRPERAVPSGVMNAYFMYRVSDTRPYFSPLRFSFCELLTLTRQFQCQSNHDKLFGLLGLPTTDRINSMITPDYTKPLPAIYHDVAYAMTHSIRSLDFLSHVHHPLTTCNSAFGRQYEPDDKDIPSWVPIWHIRGPQTLTPLDHDNAGFSFTAGLAKPAQFSSRGGEDWIPPDRLVVRGMLLESVQGTGIIRTVNFSEDQSMDRAACEHVLSQYRHSKRDLERLAMTLAAGKSWYGTPLTDPASNLADFAACLLENRLWLALDPSTFGLEICNTTAHENAEGMDIDGMEISSGDSCITSNELEAIASGGNADVFLDAAATACIGRSLFCTASLKLGVGPKEMQPDDQVCIIYGTRVPFIIRQCEEKEGYTFVGECYIREYMNGETIRDGTYEETWIELV
ncbi:heterokaryon incompatibility protein-domain-containing protein [Immersiella caudata]|uniref:Heterokaryon incompatibility protein-domain-containing protein n=1 Tax=Immersiella caudata TaxID=314043 RepID=A0AA40C6Q8_9PEZI|nr:heterokaryon incompatibility protein-domain-containing protein [Immersiella caudata]